MTSTTEHLPAAVTLQCPMCGRTVTTGQSGNTTRCPKTRGGCGAAIPVPAGVTRPPVDVDCRECGHTWATRAKGGATIRCPECAHPRRVPTAARTTAVPAAVTPRPAPARRTARPTPRRAPAPRPAPRDTAPDEWAEDDRETDQERAGRHASTRRLLEELRELRRPAQAPTPAPARPPVRPAPQPAPPSGRRFTPRPASAPAPVTAPAAARRRTAAAAFLDALGGALRLRTDAPYGGCEALDPTQPLEHRACGQRAALTVQFTDQRGRQTLIHTCTTHAETLRYLATTRPGLRATLRTYSSA